jgi:hypothetical protein
MIQLALDLTGHLEGEYGQTVNEFVSDEDYESDLAILYHQILEERDAYVTSVASALPDDGRAFFKNLGCAHDVEPALFGLGYSNSDVYVYSQSGWTGGLKPRCYPSQYAPLEKKYLPNNYNLHKSLNRLLADHGCPSDWASLCRLLKANHARAHRPEGYRCEYKVTLDQNVFDKLPRTTCAMLNADGGYIFIGVSDDRRVVGFNENVDEDAINNKILGTIAPKPTGLFFITTVGDIPTEVVGDRSVMVIYVQKGATTYRCTTGKYRGEYKRSNASDTKVDQAGSII